MTISIRQERPEDYRLIEKLTAQAFLNAPHSDQTEHLLVKRLRQSDAFVPELSLVAVTGDDEIVGHIMLSKISIVGSDRSTVSLALAPVSVASEQQNLGIGSQLIHSALQKAETLGYQSVIVLGHPAYYPKFGFERASLWNIRPPFDVPDAAFMAIELVKGSLEDIEGTVQYSNAFGE